MADGDGLNAFNESLRTIAVHRSDQTQLLEKYNNFHVDLTGIPNFDGTGESAWHFIQALTILSQSRGWPTGQKGTGRFINAANVYTEARANATGAPHHPFSRDIDAATTTQQEKNQGLAKKQPWEFITYNAYNQPEIGATGQGLNGSPTLAQQVWTNPELDGYELVEGTTIIAANGRLATAQTCYPRIRGKFRAIAAPADGTTFQFGPTNDCQRSQRLIQALLVKFVGSARNWLLTYQTDPNNLTNFPRTLFSHRFTGQAEKPNNGYGFIDLLEEEFLPQSFRDEKYLELKQLNYLNYPLPVNSLTGQVEPRNMRTFVRWYETCLGIAKMKGAYGDMINEKFEFYQKIKPDIIEALNTYEINNNAPFANMKKVYEKAIEIESKLIYRGRTSSSVLPFIGKTQNIPNYHFMHESSYRNPYIQTGIAHERPRGGTHRRGRGRTRRAYNIEAEYDEPMELLGKDMYEMNINNVTTPQRAYGFESRAQRFGKGGRTEITQGTFIDKSKSRCFTCGELGHFANECRRNLRSRPRTPTMNRSRSRTRKTQENYRRRSTSRGRNQQNYRRRSTSRGRRNQQNYNNKPRQYIEPTPNEISYRESYVNHVENYDDELYTPGYIQSNNPNYNQYNDEIESIYDDYDYNDGNNHQTNDIYEDDFNYDYENDRRNRHLDNAQDYYDSTDRYDEGNDDDY